MSNFEAIIKLLGIMFRDALIIGLGAACLYAYVIKTSRHS